MNQENNCADPYNPVINLHCMTPQQNQGTPQQGENHPYLLSENKNVSSSSLQKSPEKSSTKKSNSSSSLKNKTTNIELDFIESTGKRDSSKKFSCLYCKKFITNIRRHYLQVHHLESEVSKVKECAELVPRRERNC